MNQLKKYYIQQLQVVQQNTDKRIRDLNDSIKELKSLDGKINVDKTQINLPGSDTLEYEIHVSNLIFSNKY